MEEWHTSDYLNIIKVCRPGRHYSDYYICSYFEVTATHFKFGHPWVHLCVPNLQNESQILDGMTVYQGSSCSNSCWVKCPNVMAVVKTVVRGINDKGKLKLIRWSLLITVAPLFIIITIITPPVNTTTLPKVAHMRLDSLTSCSFGFFLQKLYFQSPSQATKTHPLILNSLQLVTMWPKPCNRP